MHDANMFSMFIRHLDADRLIKEKSFFLLGPRQTGKSTLLKTTVDHASWVDLLDASIFRQLANEPHRLIDWLANSKRKIIIIDEIQKLPPLLDEVHRIMNSSKGIRFILTGSSARKLRRSGVNLLGGRARRYHLHPIVFPELGNDFEWTDKLKWGGIPSILLSAHPKEDLIAYVDLYLKEEIQAEAHTRSIQNFSRFLESSALCNGEQLNLTKVGNDCQVSPRTIRDYFDLLHDTLFGVYLDPFQKTKKRKAVSISKFYYFDVGVGNALLGRWSPKVGTPEFGRALEHLIFTEIRAAIDYLRADAKLFFWRSKSQLEVDFVIENRKSILGIEVKAGRAISKIDCKGLLALEDDVSGIKKLVVSMEPRPRLTQEGVQIIPVKSFLVDLWKGAFFD